MDQVTVNYQGKQVTASIPTCSIVIESCSEGDDCD